MNYLDVLKSVAFGERWFVTDEVSAAASAALLKIKHNGLEIDSLTKELASGRATVKDATLQANEARKQVDYYNKLHSEVGKKNCSLLKEKTELASKLDALNNRYLTLKQVFDKNDTELAYFKERVNILSAECEELAKQRNKAQQQAQTAVKESSVATERYESAVAALNTLQDDLTRAIKQKEDAVAALQVAHGRIAQTDQRAAFAEGRLKNALERVEVMEKNLAKFTDAKEKIHQLLGELASAVEKMGE
jgi:chromosome segregation ATPase